MTLDRLARKMLCLDESRVWNMKMSWTKDKSAFGGRISYLTGYLENEILMKSLMGVTGSSFDFTTVTSPYKNAYLNAYVLDKSRLGEFEVFFSSSNDVFKKVVLHYFSSSVVRSINRIIRLFVPKFYDDRIDKNVLKGLKFVGEKSDTDETGFSEYSSLLGRKLYEYRLDPSKTYKNIVGINPNDLDWPFPDKWYNSIGYTVH